MDSSCNLYAEAYESPGLRVLLGVLVEIPLQRQPSLEVWGALEVELEEELEEELAATALEARALEARALEARALEATALVPAVLVPSLFVALDTLFADVLRLQV